MLIGNARCHQLALLPAHAAILVTDTALAILVDLGVWTALQMVALTIISLRPGYFASVPEGLAWHNALRVKAITLGSPRPNF
ncbi:hypothetical protein ACVIGA_003249 [Bradyrhizobium sp. USDA 3240]